MANKFQNPWDVGGEYYNQNAVHTEYLPEGFLETKQSYQEWKAEREQGKSSGTNPPTEAYLVNDSDYTIYFKPEEDMTVDGKEYANGGSYPLAPKQSWHYGIDGVAAPHLKKEKVYKVSTGSSVTVTNNDIDYKSAGLKSWAGNVIEGRWQGVNWLDDISADVIITEHKNIFGMTYETVNDKRPKGGGDKSWINLFGSAGLKNLSKYRSNNYTIRKVNFLAK